MFIKGEGMGQRSMIFMTSHSNLMKPQRIYNGSTKTNVYLKKVQRSTIFIVTTRSLAVTSIAMLATFSSISGSPVHADASSL